MKGVELLFLAIAALQPGQFQIVMEGRDPTTLANLDHVLRGTCDGRQASATIERAIRGRAGRLTIRVGRFVRQVPDGFLGGRLFRSSFFAAGLACDGQSVIFRARVARMDGEGRVDIDVQSVSMHMRTGRLTVSEPRTLGRDEVALELR